MAPERRPATLPASDPAALVAAAAAMEAGGIVGLPTETVYGLGVVPRPEALRALVAAKQRSDEKGIVLLIDGLEQVAGLVELPDPAVRLADRLWPGALTLVLPLVRPEGVPTLLTGGRTTLGLRISDHAVPRALAQRLGPIAVSSANRSGGRDARTAEELIEQVGVSLALVLDDGPVRGGVPSTVVSVELDGSIAVLRAGAIEETYVRSIAAGRG